MPYRSRRGQLLTTDFILSLAIFLAILLASMNIWGNVDTQIKDAEARRDMQAITTYVSENLVRSQGFPKNWTNSTVLMIGLAKDEHVLDIDKIISLKKTDYDRTRDILRLGDYNYYLWITDGAGYDLTTGIVRSPALVISRSKDHMQYAKMLNGSVVKWDLYWIQAPQGSIDLGIANSLNSRANTGYATPVALVTDLNSQLNINSSLYRTIIIEDLGVNNDDVADISGFKKFVNNGGILVYTDTLASATKPFVIGWSGMSSTAPTAGNSIVNFSKPLLINASKGDPISFTTRTRNIYRDMSKNNGILNSIANSTDNIGCNICWWDYGFGRIYYIEDNQGTYNVTSPSSDSLLLHLNIVGENMTMGVRPGNRSDLVNVKRIVLISSFEREVANLNLVVWR